METLELDALCLCAQDYKENDKIITLYTTEKGKINVIAKGCKKPKAKLKFASSPFCFGKYYLAKRGSIYTLTGCESYEMFFSVVEDIEKYYAGCVVLEILNKMSLEDDFNPAFFTLSLRCIKDICYDDIDVKKTLFEYIHKSLLLLGYKVNAITLVDYLNYFYYSHNVKIQSLKQFLLMKE